MATSKARYQGGTQYGGPSDSGGGTQKIPYNQDMLQMLIAKTG
jgi:hypothetical protein